MNSQETKGDRPSSCENSQRRLFVKRARQLIDELNQATGPENLKDWNIRAQTLLTFEICRQIGWLETERAA